MKKQILIIFLSLIFILLSSCQSFEKKDATDEELKTYLEQNKIEYNQDIEESDNLKDFDQDIEKYRVILTGEVHYLDKNDDIVLSFIKYLNKKHDIKYLICEHSFSLAQLYNKYLETGDMSYLMNNGRIKVEETIFFLKKLYAFNHILPESKKIKMIGIDVEKDFTNVLIYQYLLLKDKSYQIDKNLKLLSALYYQIEGQFGYNKNSLNQKYYDYQEKYYQIIDSIISKNKSDSQYYNDILENDYDNFFRSIQSIQQNRKFVKELNKIGLGAATSSAVEYKIKRDSIICENLIENLEKYPDDKFFGSFGWYHVFKLPDFADFTTFTQVLNENKKYKNSVIAITIMYQNRDKNFHERNVIKNKYENLFFDLSTSNFTLYKLDSKKSPFTKKGVNLLFPYPKHLIHKISTVMNFQYIIVANGVNKIKFLEHGEK